MIYRGKRNMSVNSAMSYKDRRIQTKWHIPEIQPPSKKKIKVGTAMVFGERKPGREAALRGL